MLFTPRNVFILFCIMLLAYLSQFVWGHDNWFEQFGEWILFKITGNVMDVSVE